MVQVALVPGEQGFEHIGSVEQLFGHNALAQEQQHSEQCSHVLLGIVHSVLILRSRI